MKVKSLIVLYVLLTNCYSLMAQLQLSDVRDFSMGNASVGCISTNEISENLASMLVTKGAFVSCNVTMNYFIRDLSPVFASIYKSFNDKTAMLGSIGRMGNKAFSEQFAEGGIAKKIGKNLSAAIKLQYHQWTLNDSHYNNSYAFIPTISLFASPLNNFSFGALIRNPVRNRMNAIEQNRLPAQIKTGASYRVSDKLILACSVNQQTHQKTSCQAGIEYIYHPSLMLRLGWHTLPVSETFGFALLLSKLKMEFSIQTHPVLGNSSSISLTFLI